jgi:uncharacterized membrane protein
MNRAHFMAQLRDGLAGLHHTDINDIIADYESHFTDGAADGRTEQEVAAALGDPARLARELRAEVGFKRWEENRSAGNFMGVVLALLGLATIDLIFLLPALLVMIAIFLAVGVCCLAFIAGGAFLVFGLLGFHHKPGHEMAQLLFGIGLASGGVGIGALLLLITDAIAKLLIRYARLHFRLFDTANASI